VNPRSEDRHDVSGQPDAGADLTLGGDRTPAPAANDDAPFNLTMYLDFLPGTD